MFLDYQPIFKEFHSDIIAERSIMNFSMLNPLKIYGIIPNFCFAAVNYHETHSSLMHIKFQRFMATKEKA